MLVTFLLVTYSQERFVGDAVRSALEQEYDPLEIIVSDDCSPDRTYDILQEETTDYAGSHEIRVLRNDQNLGLVGNLNAAMTHVRGELVIVAAGDDISCPDRTATLVSAYLRSGKQAKSIYSNAIIVDKHGDRQGCFFRQPRPDRLDLRGLAWADGGVLGCTQAWAKEVFDVFGPISPEVQREDAVIPFRAAMLGHVAYLDKPLVHYRRHGANAHFASPHEVDGRSELYTALRRHSLGNVAVAAARLEDLEMFRSLGRHNAYLDMATVASKRLLAEKTLEHELLNVHGRLQQVIIILKGARLRLPLRRLARWLLVAFAPKAYLKSQRRLAP